MEKSPWPQFISPKTGRSYFVLETVEIPSLVSVLSCSRLLGEAPEGDYFAKVQLRWTGWSQFGPWHICRSGVSLHWREVI